MGGAALAPTTATSAVLPIDSFGRRTFERLMATMTVVRDGNTLTVIADDLIASNYDLRDGGLWLRADAADAPLTKGDEHLSLRWTPACDVQGVDPLNAPALAFPFDAHQLAAFMLGGYGYFLAARLSILGDSYTQILRDGPDLSLLGGVDEFGVREVLTQARHAMLSADQRVCEQDALLGQHINEARAAYDLAIREQEKAVMQESQPAYEASERERQTALRSLHELEGAWRKAMVQNLLQPPKSAQGAAPNAIVQRQDERLKSFRNHGGLLKRAGSVWHCDNKMGKRGALQRVVEESAGQPMADRKNVRNDIIYAWAREEQSARSGDKRGT
jgi:hypothetical protein